MTNYYELRLDDGIRERSHYPYSSFYLKSEAPIEFGVEYPGRERGSVTLKKITQQIYEEMVAAAKRFAEKK